MRFFLAALIAVALCSGFMVRSIRLSTPLDDLKVLMGYGAEAPFYVVAVTRTGNEPMSGLDICLLELVLDRLINGTQHNDADVEARMRAAFDRILTRTKAAIEAHELPDPSIWPTLPGSHREIPTETRNSYPLLPHMLPDMKVFRSSNQSNQFVKEYGEIYRKVQIPDMSRMLRANPLLVTLSEGFFQGTAGGGKGATAVMSLRRAEEIGREFSLLATNLLLSINTTDIAPYEDADDAQKLRRDFRDSFNDERCSVTCWPLIRPWIQSRELPQFTLRNITRVWRSGIQIMSYLKSTYVAESDSLLKHKLALYQIGDFREVPIGQIGEALVRAVRFFTCKDVFCWYKHVVWRKVEDRPHTLTLVQANSVMNNFYLSSFIKELKQLDDRLAEAAINRWRYPSPGYLPRFFIYNDTGKIMNRFLRSHGIKPSIAQLPFPTMLELDPKTGEYKSRDAVLTIMFNSGEDQIRIDVHKI
ncbi:MAG: hypothetical protein LBC25_00405 [Holosporales bacterium]|jgi:hypothetical protein|nr:hypothetical protein [Holosporales bacterium]